MQITNAAGTFHGDFIPRLGFVMFAPEPILDSNRFIRLHKKISRDVMKAVLMEHHQQRIPRHFDRDASSRYQYQERTDATKRIKQSRYHHNVDLVQSGRTKRSMVNSFPRVRITGDATKVLEGHMRYNFPFPVNRDATDPRHVTMAKMGDEIARMTDEEQRQMIERFAELYAADLRYELSTRPKMRAAAEAAGFQ